MVHSATVEYARLRDAGVLNKLFIQSIESSFNYFSISYQEQLRREHTRLRFLKALCSTQSCFFLARFQNRPVGFSLARMDGQKTGFIHWMYVDPMMQGHGLGAALLASSQQGLCRKGVEQIRLLTHDQVGFYQHLGYVERGEMKGCNGGVPMFLMEAHI